MMEISLLRVRGNSAAKMAAGFKGVKEYAVLRRPVKIPELRRRACQ